MEESPSVVKNAAWVSKPRLFEASKSLYLHMANLAMFERPVGRIRRGKKVIQKFHYSFIRGIG